VVTAEDRSARSIGNACQQDDEKFGGVISNKNAFSCVLASSRPFFFFLFLFLQCDQSCD
jgi:hypothetical protein